MPPTSTILTDLMIKDKFIMEVITGLPNNSTLS